MDKHLLAENPMRAPEGGLCIIRTVQPISIYQIEIGWVSFLGEKAPLHKIYSYINSDGEKEKYTLRAHHFFSTDIDTVNEDIVYKFMDDAWYWFKAYLEWEDKNIDENE